MVEWLGSAAALVAWGFALYVYVIAPASTSSRLLIAMLIVDGVAVLSSWQFWHPVDTFLQLGEGVWWRVHAASDWAVIGVYLAFVGATVQSPLARPLSGALMRKLLITGGAVMALAMVPLENAFFVSRVAPALYTLIAISLTWGFAAAIHAWITAQDKGSRSRACAFAVAFGVRDTIWVVTFLFSVMFTMGYFDDQSTITPYAGMLYVSAVIVYVPLVAYGMLRTQLFDIDLRLKRTLKRSTVMAIFVAVFFLVFGLAELYLSRMLGGLLGLLCTSALVFFLDPLQRAAERLSDAAMPGTRDTPEYEAFRKLQVYEATLHASIDHGELPLHRRTVLDTLIESLGIDPAIARRLEEDALAKYTAVR